MALMVVTRVVNLHYFCQRLSVSKRIAQSLHLHITVSASLKAPHVKCAAWNCRLITRIQLDRWTNILGLHFENL